MDPIKKQEEAMRKQIDEASKNLMMLNKQRDKQRSLKEMTAQYWSTE